MKTKVSILFVLMIIISLSTSCVNNKSQNDSTQAAEKPKNIILMIGDGMGNSQVSAALFTLDSPTAFERFPYSGMVKTHSKSNKITDSAAGGTAIATGHKTNNGMIGMDSDSIPVTSMLEFFSEKGMKTGIVVTTYITHATPASFVAKNINRNNYEEIALDFAQCDVNILIGGGRKHFNKRKDKRNIIDEMTEDGWHYYDTLDKIEHLDKILVLADDGHMNTYPQRGEFLPDATSIALEKLKNENGFFLMVEGSQIDFAGHNNDSLYLVNELRDFNNTINVVMDFAEKNPNTLVLVTADHETGGLTFIDPRGRYTETYYCFSTGSHSPSLVPIFSYGPGAENFSGIMDNTEIIKRIMEVVE